MMIWQPTMSESAPRVSPPQPPDGYDALLKDESTVELVVRARAGDRMAVEALMQRCLPALTRWAHGKLPAAARGVIDTGDLVQDAAMHALQRLDTFEPRHVGAMQAYLRQSVINRIRDEVRRIVRHPAAVELPDEHPADGTSPLEFAIEKESYERYRRGLGTLKPRDREMVVARVELHWSLGEIAQRFGMRTADAARMAVGRALRRLAAQMAAREVIGHRATGLRPRVSGAASRRPSRLRQIGSLCDPSRRGSPKRGTREVLT